VFERFTEEARQVVVVAAEEARRLGHNYIGTEHLLLGLLHDGEGIAGAVLRSVGLEIEAVREQITRIVGPGEQEPSGQQIPFTPRAKKVLELALREALALHGDFIDTEHLLLGLIREGDGVAARVLIERGVGLEALRSAVMRSVAARPQRAMASVPAVGHAGEGWLDGLQRLIDQLGRDIRRHLRRPPDPGDLLLVLACLTDQLPGRALSQLQVEPDALWATIEQLRTERAAAADELQTQIDETAREKGRAIEEQRVDDAARLRNRERELRLQAYQLATPEIERALEEARRRLGIPEV